MIVRNKSKTFITLKIKDDIKQLCEIKETDTIKDAFKTAASLNESFKKYKIISAKYNEISIDLNKSILAYKEILQNKDKNVEILLEARPVKSESNANNNNNNQQFNRILNNNLKYIKNNEPIYNKNQAIKRVVEDKTAQNYLTKRDKTMMADAKVMEGDGGSRDKNLRISDDKTAFKNKSGQNEDKKNDEKINKSNRQNNIANNSEKNREKTEDAKVKDNSNDININVKDNINDININVKDINNIKGNININNDNHNININNDNININNNSNINNDTDSVATVKNININVINNNNNDNNGSDSNKSDQSNIRVNTYDSALDSERKALSSSDSDLTNQNNLQNGANQSINSSQKNQDNSSVSNQNRNNLNDTNSDRNKREVSKHVNLNNFFLGFRNLFSKAKNPVRKEERPISLCSFLVSKSVF